MRKTFTTTIEMDIQERFKKVCKDNNTKMNDVLEAFMKEYISGKFILETEFKLREVK